MYGAAIITPPQHGRLEISDRTVVRYYPANGFEGDDRFTFELVGKRNGTTPDSVKINVRVAVKK